MTERMSLIQKYVRNRVKKPIHSDALTQQRKSMPEFNLDTLFCNKVITFINFSQNFQYLNLHHVTTNLPICTQLIMMSGTKYVGAIKNDNV